MSSLNLSHAIPPSTLAQATSRSNHQTSRGFFFHQSRNYADALKCYQDALHLNPKNSRAYFLSGQVHHTLHDYPEAKTAYEKSIICKPDFTPPITSLAKLALDTCNWSLFDQVVQQFPSPLPEHSVSAELYQLLTLHQPKLAKKLKLQQNWLNFVTYQASPYLEYFTKNKASHLAGKKIRLGYLSSQFNNSHTGRQLLHLLAHHDRNLFEVYAISTSIEDGSTLSKQLATRADKYLSKPDADISSLASLIRYEGIDILIHLDTHLSLNSSSAFFLHAAPLQIQFPGATISPISPTTYSRVSDATLYSKKSAQDIILKPSWYMSVPLPLPGKHSLSKQTANLPLDKFIFASFVSPDQIDHSTFNTWLNVLSLVPDSILWLSSMHPDTKASLVAQASDANISQDRILFEAPQISQFLTFQKLSLADIYLESPHINNNHLSALALYQSVPVISTLGEHPHQRTTASLLKSINIPSLITKNLSSYQETAVHLASNPNKLADIRTKIEASKLPFFDPFSTLPQYEKQLNKLWKSLNTS